MRTMLSAVRTLPSSTCATCSARPIESTPTSLFLNANDDVRAATRSSGSFASTLSSSSVRPSEKYAWSFPALMSRNGSTAMDPCSATCTTPASSNGTSPAAGPAPTPVPTPRPTSVTPVAAMTQIPVSRPISMPLTRCVPRSPWYQAMTSAARKPTASNAATTRNVAVSQPKLSTTRSTTCSTSQAPAR